MHLACNRNYLAVKEDDNFLLAVHSDHECQSLHRSINLQSTVY